MTYPFVLGDIEYAPETAFAETSTTFATHRINAIGPPDVSGLKHDKEPVGNIKAYMHDDQEYVLMGQSGTFDITLDATGHGATMVGSPTIDALETFLGYVFGNVSASLPASTTLTGGTATAPTTTASGTFPAGGLCRIGAAGDARGNGQFHRIGTHAATTLNLLTGMNDTPTNGDVLYPATNFYFHETAFGHGINASVPGLRFRFLTPGLQYTCHGCAPVGLKLSGLSAGQRPQWTITYEVSRWSAVTGGTFPSAVTKNQYNPSSVARGSLFVNTVGTATRATRNARELTLDITLGMTMLPSHGTVGQYQKWGACTRMPSSVKWSWIEDADAAATATPVIQTYGTAGTPKHILLTLSSADGSAVGLYSPNVRVSSVATPFNHNGVQSVRFEGMACTGPTKTNDLTASMLVAAYS